MKNNDIYIKERVNNILLWGICFVLFLPIIVLPPTFQPSEWSRTILFRIALTLLISFMAFKYFYKKEISISVPKWKNPVYLPFFILSSFFITLILATIFSEDSRFSFFGSPNRAGGILNLLFYFAFATLLAIFIKESNWKKLWKFLFFVGSLTSLMAIIQYFNLFGKFLISYTGAPPSLLGNSTFLAIYMLFLAFFSFIFFIQEKVKKIKIAYLLLFFLFILTILITGSRATYLGVLIGFLYFFFFYPTENYGTPGGYLKKLKALKIIAVGSLIFASLVVFYVNVTPKLPNFIESNTRLSYFVHNRLSVKIVFEDLFRTRLSVWQITLQAIKDKPFLGWGPENFYIGFEKYYEPTVADLQRLWWDRPHNVLLDIAVHSGLLSLLFYTAFWITLLWSLQKFKKRETDYKKIHLAHGLQAMFIGYLIALFFNFDTFVTYFISFFFIGYSFYLISSQKESIEIKNGQEIINYKNKKIWGIFFIAILSIFVYFWNIKPLYKNESINYAKALSDVKRCDESLSIMENVWNKSFMLKAYSGLIYADIIKNCASLAPEKEVEYSQKALDVLKVSSKIQPKFTRTWLFMGSFTNILAARAESAEVKNKFMLEARGYLEKALSLSPKHQEIFEEIEKNYLMAGDYQAMIKSSNDCIKIDPRQGLCYWYLGVAEIFMGDQENGKKHVQESKEKNYNVPPYGQLGAAYISQKNYEDALDAYYWATVYYPKNASYHATLAFLYKMKGDYKRAEIEALEVFKLQPENKDTIDFIQALLGLNPNDPTIHGTMAYIYQQVGQEDKARQELLIAKSLYLQLIAKQPNAAEYHYNLAIIYRELKDYENSYKEAFLTIKLEPTFKVKTEKLLQSLPKEFWIKYNTEIKEALR